MRYVIIEKAKTNMVLARPLYDGMNRALLKKGTVLTYTYIKKLQERGYPGFYVEDELAKDIVIRDVISQKLRNKGVEALRKGNIDAAMKVSEKIVEQILANPNVSLDMVDLRTYDDYTYRHSVNVAVMCTVIGMNMGLNRKALRDLCVSGMLHDIGKSKLDPNILNKPSSFTDEEYAYIKQHAQEGFDLLRKRMDINCRVRIGVLSHHENEDGSGYPNGFSGSKIHLFAKIIHVADVFDALTSKRPYKPAYAKAEAVEYMMGACGRLFDREVVEAFIQSVTLYPLGTEVHLSDGREAIVIANRNNSIRPVVRSYEGERIDLNDLVKYRNVVIVPEAMGEVVLV